MNRYQQEIAALFGAHTFGAALTARSGIARMYRLDTCAVCMQVFTSGLCININQPTHNVYMERYQQEIAALSGALALGAAHTARSGFWRDVSTHV